MIRFGVAGATVELVAPTTLLSLAAERLRLASFAASGNHTGAWVQIGDPGPSAAWIDSELPQLGRYRIEDHTVIASTPDDPAGVEAALRLGLALALQEGLLLHAAGLCVGDRAVIAPAPSEAGKSTLCRLSKAPLLSDEAVAVVRDGAGFRAVATPFMSTCGRRALPSLSAPLGAVLLLEKAAAPGIVAAPGSAAVSSLVSQSFAAAGETDLRRRFELSCQIAAAVPSFVFRFGKNEDVDGLLQRLPWLR